MSEPVRIGLIVDDRSVTRWQAEGLLRLRGRYDVILYDCSNSRPGRRSARNSLYYLLNLCTIRNRWTQRVSLPAELPLAGEVGFEAGQDGACRNRGTEIGGGRYTCNRPNRRCNWN